MGAMNRDEQVFRDVIVAGGPAGYYAAQVYADWLDDHDRHDEAVDMRGLRKLPSHKTLHRKLQKKWKRHKGQTKLCVQCGKSMKFEMSPDRRHVKWWLQEMPLLYWICALRRHVDQVYWPGGGNGRRTLCSPSNGAQEGLVRKSGLSGFESQLGILDRRFIITAPL